MGLAFAVALAGLSGRADAQTFPPHTTVLKDYTKVVSTIDGQRPLYTIYKHTTEPRMLAELPAAYASQKYFLALTVAGGERFAGLQAGELYFYWRKYGKRLAMIQPNVEVRSTGDSESKASVKRLFTDRVMLDTPIITMGPTGGPVIDLNSILVNQSSFFFGLRITNPYLISIKKAKAFPKNMEVAIEGPTSGFGGFFGSEPSGTLKTLHYSISLIHSSPGYRPRKADPRIGYFTTSYSDLGKYKDTETRVRYINRWHLAKRDSSLKLSPPVKPITFYLEHTVPVRYRRWVTQGVEYWNKAFEKVGILGAIEVDYQDTQTKRNMELDPEDVRYNFIRWLNNDIGTAIGPSRVNPLTGEILDADIILTDGWIRHYYHQFSEILPAVAVEGFSPETLSWLADHPRWDPRVRLAPPSERRHIMQQIRRDAMLPLAGHPAGKPHTHMLGDDIYDGLLNRTSQKNGLCLAAQGKSMDLAAMQLHLAILAADAGKKGDKGDKDDDKDGDKDDEDGDKDDEEKKDDDAKEEEKKPEEQKLDGIPESFIGPLIAELVAHEVGHTLGLRHNFKASSIYSLEEINSDEVRGKKPLAGSVMDYLPVNIVAEDGKAQGDWSMLSIGPYDEWAIEYGYTLSDSSLPKILARVGEPALIYGTDEDTGGADPRSRRYDFSKDPLDFAHNQIALVNKHRARLVDDFVKDGESWARARYGYELSLSLQMRATSMMANWLGGAFTNRGRKGDKDVGRPVEVVPCDQQRAALAFVIDNTFQDGAYGLTPELLAHMTVDKWLDSSSTFSRSSEAAWPIHDQIASIQASTLSMLMNPTTLRRVYDNEIRIPADQDAVALPEILSSLSDSIWTELKKNPDKQYTSRVPFVSSLRRNLQQEHLGRLVDLSIPSDSETNESDKPIANLASAELNGILANINRILSNGKARKMLDPYTAAHLTKLKEQVDKLKDSQFIYNASDVGGGGGSGGFFIFQNEQKQQQRQPFQPTAPLPLPAPLPEAPVDPAPVVAPQQP